MIGVDIMSWIDLYLYVKKFFLVGFDLMIGLEITLYSALMLYSN